MRQSTFLSCSRWTFFRGILCKIDVNLISEEYRKNASNSALPHLYKKCNDNSLPLDSRYRDRLFTNFVSVLLYERRLPCGFNGSLYCFGNHSNYTTAFPFKKMELLRRLCQMYALYMGFSRTHSNGMSREQCNDLQDMKE